MILKRKALAEAFFTLLGVCLLGIVAYFFSDAIGPIPDEPIEQHVESVESMTPYGERSGKWQAVRNEFVELHPRCEACGLSWGLNVHHIKPFKDHPELELDMDNLITLCREHHFRIGHDPDGPWGWRRPSWTLSNPNVREDVKRWRKK